MKNIVILIASLISIIIYSQQGNVGINTDTPTNTLDVNGDLRIRTIKILSQVPTYVLVPDANGVVSQISSDSLKTKNTNPTDATRFLGGTAYVIFQTSSSGGSLASSNVINGGTGTYSMGTTSGITAKAGAINSIKGKGYTISNPSLGIFDIKFTNPFKNIYGVSSNIVDSYTTGVAGDNPQTSKPGTPLRTTDNSQISYLDNSSLRVKTGDQSGNLSNRSFTFLITGQ